MVQLSIPEWAQTALAMPNESRYVDVDGCRVHYLSWGDPGLPPLMLVHGNAALPNGGLQRAVWPISTTCWHRHGAGDIAIAPLRAGTLC